MGGNVVNLNSDDRHDIFMQISANEKNHKTTFSLNIDCSRFVISTILPIY